MRDYWSELPGLSMIGIACPRVLRQAQHERGYHSELVSLEEPKLNEPSRTVTPHPHPGH